MSSIALALCAAVGVHLLSSRHTPSRGRTVRSVRSRLDPSVLRLDAQLALERAGLDGVSPMQFGATSVGVGLAAALVSSLVIGVGVGAAVIESWPVPLPQPCGDPGGRPLGAPHRSTGPASSSDGCGDAVTIEGNVVIVGERRYRFGSEGDVVAVGDWDCDGSATPAVLRPATGAVHVFDEWATDGEPTTATAWGDVTGALTFAPSGQKTSQDRHILRSHDHGRTGGHTVTTSSPIPTDGAVDRRMLRRPASRLAGSLLLELLGIAITWSAVRPAPTAPDPRSDATLGIAADPLDVAGRVAGWIAVVLLTYLVVLTALQLIALLSHAAAPSRPAGPRLAAVAARLGPRTLSGFAAAALMLSAGACGRPAVRASDRAADPTDRVEMALEDPNDALAVDDVVTMELDASASLPGPSSGNSPPPAQPVVRRPLRRRRTPIPGCPSLWCQMALRPSWSSEVTASGTSRRPLSPTGPGGRRQRRKPTPTNDC